MADLYSGAELGALILFIQPRPFYMLERVFNDDTFNLETDELIFVDVFDDVLIAPFVSPVSNGKPVVHLGSKSRGFKPGYVKLSDPITLQQISRRRPGQAINTPVDRMANLDDARIKRLGQHRRSILTRMELMCWQYALDGAYDVKGDDYPTKNVNFGRDAGNTVVLSGAALWSAPTTAKPLTNWAAWSRITLDKAGVAANRLIMSPEAFDYASKTDEFKEEYKNFKSNGGPIPNISPALAAVIDYKGRYGSFEIEVVNTKYLDESGVEQRYLPANKVLCVAAGPDALCGVKIYGLIQHLAAVEQGVTSVDAFHHEWAVPNGSAINIDTDSAPLIAAKRVNAIVAATIS